MEREAVPTAGLNVGLRNHLGWITTASQAIAGMRAPRSVGLDGHCKPLILLPHCALSVTGINFAHFTQRPPAVRLNR
jgi:hypothetical protein